MAFTAVECVSTVNTTRGPVHNTYRRDANVASGGDTPPAALIGERKETCASSIPAILRCALVSGVTSCKMHRYRQGNLSRQILRCAVLKLKRVRTIRVFAYLVALFVCSTRLAPDSRVRLLVVDEILPVTHIGSGVRMLQLLEWFLEHDVLLTIATRQPYWDRIEHEAQLLKLRRAGATVLSGPKRFKTLLKGRRLHDYDLVVITLWFWPLCNSETLTLPSLILPQLQRLQHVRKIVISDDVHTLRALTVQKEYCHQVVDDVLRTEKEVTLMADYVVYINSRDANSAANLLDLPRNKILVLPYKLRTGLILPYRARSTSVHNIIWFGFLGAVSAHNTDSARLLLNEIFPRIRQGLPTARLSLAGDNGYNTLVSEAISLYSDCKDCVESSGVVRNINDWRTKIDVYLAMHPATSSGCSMKVLTALETGRQVVTTPTGTADVDCSQHDELCDHIVVAVGDGNSSIVQFAKAAVKAGKRLAELRTERTLAKLKDALLRRQQTAWSDTILSQAFLKRKTSSL